KYMLVLPDQQRVTEGGNDRIIDIPRNNITTVNLVDAWNNPAEFENAFYTAPFRDVLLPAGSAAPRGRRQRAAFTHIFKIKAPLLKKQEVVCLAGSGESLKYWSTDHPLLLSLEGNWWTI